MENLLEFLVQYGYLVVFGWVLLGQAGLPVPALPLLIAAGALAGAGKLDVWVVAALAIVASLISDSVWFVIGRRRGGRVLHFLCRVSLEPENCVRRTQSTFARRGGLTLVVAKFVPGLNTVAPPLAGTIGMGWSRFLLLDGVGALIWTASAVVPGYVFSDQLERIAGQAALTGAWLLGIFAAIVVGYVAVKFVLRQLFLRRLRIARVTADELNQLLAGSTPPFVVDLRQELHFDSDPLVIPGALRLNAEEIEARHLEIPRDRDVVLYCT